MWNIDMVTREHGTGQVQVEEVTNGYLPIKSHTAVSIKFHSSYFYYILFTVNRTCLIQH